jgi:hypothetical protein
MGKKTTRPAPQNRAKTGDRDGGGRFSAGTSGNPGGRPRMLRELKERIQVRGAELVDALFAIALAAPRKGAPSPRERALAARVLLDIGYGRPVQAVEVSGRNGGPLVTRDISQLTSTERRARLNELLAKASVPRDGTASAEAGGADTQALVATAGVAAAAAVAAEDDDEDEDEGEGQADA